MVFKREEREETKKRAKGHEQGQKERTAQREADIHILPFRPSRTACVDIWEEVFVFSNSHNGGEKKRGQKNTNHHSLCSVKVRNELLDFCPTPKEHDFNPMKWGPCK